jgi:hypothetical protein
VWQSSLCKSLFFWKWTRRTTITVNLFKKFFKGKINSDCDCTRTTITLATTTSTIPQTVSTLTTNSTASITSVTSASSTSSTPSTSSQPPSRTCTWNVSEMFYHMR